MKVPKKMINLEGVASSVDLLNLEKKITDIDVQPLPLVGINIESKPGSAFMYKNCGKCYISARINNTGAYENGSVIAKLPQEYAPTGEVVTERYLVAHGFSIDDDTTYKKSIMIKIIGSGEILAYGNMDAVDPITTIVIPEQSFLI